MRWSSIRRTLGVAAAFAIAVNGASAQGRAEQVVPLELVQTLLDGGPFDDGPAPRVLVGSLPEITSRVLTVPTGARIIGSIVYPQSTRSALAFAAPADSVRAMMEQSLAAGGWKKLDLPQRGGFSAGGLAQARRPYCLGDSATVTLGVKPNPDGGTYLTITHMRDREHSMCGRERPQYRERRESLIPTLLPPADAQSRGSSSGGSTNSWDAHTHLRTTASIEELLEHYDAQLRAAGWQPGTTATDGSLMLRTYRLTDEEGVHWNGLFTVSGEPGASHRFLSVLAIRAEDDRP